jgi:hypothetical protein
VPGDPAKVTHQPSGLQGPHWKGLDSDDLCHPTSLQEHNLPHVFLPRPGKPCLSVGSARLRTAGAHSLAARIVDAIFFFHPGPRPQAGRRALFSLPFWSLFLPYLSFLAVKKVAHYSFCALISVSGHLGFPPSNLGSKTRGELQGEGGTE